MDGLFNLLIGLSLLQFHCCGRTLTDILSYYDTIDKVDFQHRIIRRSLTNSSDRHIGFSSHGKKFQLRLRPSTDIFASSFRAVTVDEFGIEKPMNLNLNNFYEGYVEYDASSHVTAHVDDDGSMMATIDTENNTYIIEPMWRHVDDNPSHDMIVYKASDVKWNLTSPNDRKNAEEQHISTCGNNETFDEDLKMDSTNRYRREATAKECKKVNSKDTCKLHLVADSTFFKEIGASDEKTSIYYMLQVIKRVDVIYRGTCWDGIGTGIGVQVKQVTVHRAPTSTYDNYNTRYNRQIPGGWNVDKLLTEFSRRDHSDYCLAHLFTYQDFQHGVIGLAYVASRGSRIGGIWSPKSRDSLGKRFHNCGLTTYVNWGRKLTTLEATLVTVHEIGHNFGSNHDPPSCSQSTEKGRYVMYATSVTGEKSNNKKFSRCSTRQIGGVLQSRRNYLESKGARCGNGIVEDDEQCDPGKDTSCCVKCKLTQGSICSDTNSICCTNCQITPENTKKKCRSSFTLECKGETYCNGTSSDCPEESPNLEDGTCHLSSFRRGKCTKNGVCKSLCSLSGLETCSCSAGIAACKVCCRKNVNATCEPIEQGKISENNGVQCSVKGNGEEDGLCEEGTCQKLKRNVKETFKDLLTDFTLDKAIRFMENNIVFTILFFSLLLWIPAGCIVNQVDRSEERKMKEREEMRDELFGKPKRSFKKSIADVHSGQHVGT